MAQILLELSFLFFVGSCLGWCVEVLFRRFFSAKKWINPGFLTGPYLPLYGFGLTFMYGVSFIPVKTGEVWADYLILIIIAGVLLTALEYLAGIIFIKGMKIKLWDYSSRPGNIQGIICPLFSLLWTAAAAIYIIFIHRFITGLVAWFVAHLGFAFFVGFFFGVFTIDLCHSLNLSVKIRAFAKQHNIVVSFEKLKESVKDGIERGKERAAESIKRNREKAKAKKASFLFAFKSGKSIQEMLSDYMKRREKSGSANSDSAALTEGLDLSSASDLNDGATKSQKKDLSGCNKVSTDVNKSTIGTEGGDADNYSKSENSEK